MATTFKALETMRMLKDELAPQLASNMPVVVESFDSNQNPVLTISADATPAAGERVIVIRIQTVADPDAVNIFGNAAQHFSPHQIDICTERNFEGVTDNIQDILRTGELLPVFAECARRGSVINWYMSANATVPSTAAMTAANLARTWRNLYHGNLSAS